MWETTPKRFPVRRSFGEKDVDPGGMKGEKWGPEGEALDRWFLNGGKCTPGVRARTFPGTQRMASNGEKSKVKKCATLVMEP